jgi:hypothetical protein
MLKIACVALVIASLLTACGRPTAPPPVATPATAAGPVRTITFDDLPAGTPPAGFRLAWPGPPEAKPARWEVLPAGDRPGNVLQQSDDDDTNNRFPVALVEGLSLTDARVAVRAQAVSGKRDRSFGVVVRAQDERNYYVARANTSGWGENVRLYAMVAGKRRELAEWEGPIAPEAWHDLAIEAVGNSLSVILDGRTVIRCTDTTFAGPGLAGVWTKAEAVSRFDDLVITPVQP